MHASQCGFVSGLIAEPKYYMMLHGYYANVNRYFVFYGSESNDAIPGL